MCLLLRKNPAGRNYICSEAHAFEGLAKIISRHIAQQSVSLSHQHTPCRSLSIHVREFKIVAQQFSIELLDLMVSERVHLFLQAAGVHYVRDGTPRNPYKTGGYLVSTCNMVSERCGRGWSRRLSTAALSHIFEQQKGWEMRKRLMLFPEMVSRT